MIKEMCEEPRGFISRWWRIVIVRGYPRNELEQQANVINFIIFSKFLTREVEEVEL